MSEHPTTLLGLNGVQDGDDVRARRVYLGGPMSGIPDFNFPAFRRAASVLRVGGFEVFDPSEQGEGDGDVTTGTTSEQTWREFLADDLRWIMQNADALVMLEGWERSRGATLEVKVARHAGIPVYSFPSLALIPEDRCDPECGDVCTACVEPDEVFIGIEEYEFEHRVTDSQTGGAKGRKLARFALVPALALRALARHYGIGALKYDDHNWLRGYDWDLSADALERHWNAWRRGESIYVERFTGKDGVKYAVETHHLIAVAWQAFTLYIFERLRRGRDTRPPELTFSNERLDTDDDLTEAA